MRSRRAAVVTVATLALCSARALAASPALGVELEGCSNLDASEIGRLLALELGALTGPDQPVELPPVRLTCHDASVRVSVDDPVTGKTLARDVPAPASGDPMRDRIVALAVSELFLSSWLELLLPPETRRVAPIPAPAPEVVVVRRIARRAVEPTPTRWELELRGGARCRGLTDPYFGYQPSLLAALVFSDWVRLFVATGLELDRAQRQRGQIRSRASELGGGVGLRAGGTHTLFWDAGLLLSGVLVQTSGRSDRANTLEGSVSGAGWEAALLGGPGLHFGSLSVRLEAQGGLSLPRFAARVAGETPVQWGGAWLGAALGIGLREQAP
jgi:hypothetical protein